LHREVFTHSKFYTEDFLHKASFGTEKHLHTESFYTEDLLHKASFCTEKVLHTESFYTEELLHKASFCQKFLHRASFYTEKLLHKANFCREKLLHTASVYTEKLLHRMRQNEQKYAAKAPFATFMLPLQCDLRLSAGKHNSITRALAAARNLDAAIPLRSAETELRNTIEFRTTAT